MRWSAALSSGAIGSCTGIPPTPSTRAPSASAFELTIWLGPMGSPGITTSSPVGRMATRGRRWTRSHGRFIAAASPTSRAVKAPSGLEPDRALAEIQAGRADIAAFGRALLDQHDIAAPLGILLDHDRVGAVRDGRAGEDAHRLARADNAFVALPCRHRSDNSQFRRNARHVGGAHGIAVHGRDGERRLSAARDDILGEHPAGRSGERHMLRAERLQRRQEAVARFLDRNHRFAS